MAETYDYKIDWEKCKKQGFSQEDYDIILSETTKIIENKDFFSDEELSIAFYDRGIVHSRIKEKQKAIEDYTSSIEINDKIEAYYNRGKVYFYLEQYFMALKDFLKVKEIDPNDPDIGDIDKDIDKTKKKLFF
jgi:tetratricopeptide (TPR) repeat protein